MNSTVPSRRWRTVDIVVAAVIGVTFGVVFQVWNVIWTVFTGPASALVYGVWLIPAVLSALIVRRPGASVFTETVAAAVSVMLGSPYGGMGILQGAVEGLGAEVAFAATRYRHHTVAVAAAAGALGGLAATLFDALYWYPEKSWTAFRLPYIGFGTLSCLLIAGVGSWLLTRGLAGTGALDRFAAGRERTRV